MHTKRPDNQIVRPFFAWDIISNFIRPRILLNHLILDNFPKPNLSNFAYQFEKTPTLLTNPHCFTSKIHDSKGFRSTLTFAFPS